MPVSVFLPLCNEPSEQGRQNPEHQNKHKNVQEITGQPDTEACALSANELIPSLKAFTILSPKVAASGPE